jgi:hypothetical protein
LPSRLKGESVMRAARNKLQVSTFPFLAVLLCAMGSLILFLLVMDRRAKIAARNKAREAVAVQSEQRNKLQAQADAEWEKQRTRLQQELLEQQAKAQQEAAAVQDQLAAARKKEEAEQARRDELRRAMEREQAALKQAQALIESRQAKVTETQARQVADQAEAAKLARDVAELEKAFAAVKALKMQAGHTYSVVPYRGKNGAGRRPIYVECAAGGLLFHPDRTPLAGADFSTEALRAEIERRAGGLTRAKAKPGRDEEPEEAAKYPYVLFLIRPDGIDTYYKAQAALRGFQLDFGYEVVDQHWVLDFSEANRRWAGGGNPPAPLPLVSSPGRGNSSSSGGPTPGPALGKGPAVIGSNTGVPSGPRGSGGPTGVQAPTAGSVGAPRILPAPVGFARPVIVEGDGQGTFGGVGTWRAHSSSASRVMWTRRGSRCG